MLEYGVTVCVCGCSSRKRWISHAGLRDKDLRTASSWKCQLKRITWKALLCGGTSRRKKPRKQCPCENAKKSSKKNGEPKRISGKIFAVPGGKSVGVKNAKSRRQQQCWKKLC